ncbi:MAG: 4Fe-4S binding protein [Oscillospiraceae bacterium]|nr:4Fe-4S binding protein [Oscillospiraceae bacterium]
MAKVTFATDLCKGCGLCVAACPKKIIELAKDQINKKGHSPARITEQDKCIACAFCATMCPDCVITVEK